MPVKASYDGETLIVAFSRTLASSEIKLFINDSNNAAMMTPPTVVWTSANGQKYDTLWMTKLRSNGSVIRIQLENNTKFLEVPNNGTFCRNLLLSRDGQSATKNLKVNYHFTKIS